MLVALTVGATLAGIVTFGSLTGSMLPFALQMTRAKDDLHLLVPQRFFTHGQRSQGDRHLYASRTRFIPEKLLGLFERTAWPVVPAGVAARSAGQGPKVDIGARMRGMWR
jgi:DNA helicase-2/ATP-dependent DNA helicase PcrA